MERGRPGSVDAEEGLAVVADDVVDGQLAELGGP